MLYTRPTNPSRASSSAFAFRGPTSFLVPLLVLFHVLWIGFATPAPSIAQSVGSSTLDFNGLGRVDSGTSLMFGPDGRLYVLQINGTIDVFSIVRNGADDYQVLASEEILDVKNLPNHDDVGSTNGGAEHEATGLTVAGSATHPVVYVTSSGSRIRGPSGDTNLDPNSGVLTRLAWQGIDRDDPNGFWEVTVLGTLAPVWIDKAENENYTARHECSFVQAGDRFYLFGGRENAQTLDTYDYASNAWTTNASAPIPFNHFQATQYEGLVWVIGAFQTNAFPNEVPAENVYAFDPAEDAWMQGPPIPPARQRGSAGLVVHDDKFYVIAGNTIGHNGGYVAWFDEFDPKTGIWTPLADAPRARDHFHAAVANDKLYVLGGRLSGGPGGTFAPLIPEVDVYDFATSSWSTLPPASNLPTPRAASAVALFDGEILVIGGEGNGQAYDTVEALDPATNLWATRDSLNHARHGTQAIVSGQGVYVAAGSPNQGGGNQKNMEVYNADLPAGTASVSGVLSAPATVAFSSFVPQAVTLTHDSGNEGLYVTDVSVTGNDAGNFFVQTPVADPFLIATTESKDLIVEYTGSVDGASASMVVTYSGGQTATISFVPEPAFAVSLVIGCLALVGARRARSNRPP